MARIYKDLVVDEQDGRVRVDLIDRDGNPLLTGVYVQVASKVLQEGDQWGAKEANLLLTLSDAGVPSPRTDNPHKVTAAQTGAAPKSHASAGTEYGAASTSQYGHVKLSGAVNSTSEALAATAGAVKKAYDLANTANTKAGQAAGTAEAADAAAQHAAEDAAAAQKRADSAYGLASAAVPKSAFRLQGDTLYITV